jgi:hypothetical protein
MKYSILIVAFLILSGCSSDSNPASPTTNSFAGTWGVVFAGSYTGNGDVPIGTDGKFSVSVLLVGPGGSITNTLTGTVASTGHCNGDIYYSGSNIGTLSGAFSGNGASGTYQTVQPSSGTWSAVRK